MVTHDLPYALQLCSRSAILDGGVIVAAGPTADLLADTELLARHRLELPYAFDVSRSAPAGTDTVRAAGHWPAPTIPRGGSRSKSGTDPQP
jgi:cobalt/nickel transport system ATP-binding protein